MASKTLSKLRLENLSTVEPMTDNQGKAFDAWDAGRNLILNGSAGTGKTYIALAMALEEVLDPKSPYEKVLIVRSAVSTRDIGFLPGTEDEKVEVYAAPYIDIVNKIFSTRMGWERLRAHDMVQFTSTSFVRGMTWDNVIVVLDEMQNTSAHESDSIITRLGNNTRMIMCGDYYQSDFVRANEREGILDFLKVVRTMTSFDEIEFNWTDIVRSGLVRDYIIAKQTLKNAGEIPASF